MQLVDGVTAVGQDTVPETSNASWHRLRGALSISARTPSLAGSSGGRGEVTVSVNDGHVTGFQEWVTVTGSSTERAFPMHFIEVDL